MTNVVVVIGAGSLGQAIARRVSAGKKVLLADLRPELAEDAAKIMRNAGFDVSTAVVDVSSRKSVHDLVQSATALGDVWGVIHAAGVSPSQASPSTILHVDLYGTALVLEEFGNVIAAGGSGVVIASMSGHRLPALTAEQNKALATTPADELLALPMLQPDQVTDPLNAYQISKRANSLRVMAEAVRWGKRGARVNTISPGIVITPLANDELTGPRGAGYRRYIDGSAAGRGRHPGRGREPWRAPHGPGRRLHHRQRFPSGRRGHRRILVRRPRSEPLTIANPEPPDHFTLTTVWSCVALPGPLIARPTR
jgi:NAD(P)-dependent dehydrogenase (short-subunit alcohol dehydrogenase family)